MLSKYVEEEENRMNGPIVSIDVSKGESHYQGFKDLNIKYSNVKKLLMVCLTAFLISTVLTGCGMFEKANGVILYGEEQQIIDSLEREKDELVKEDDISLEEMKYIQSKLGDKVNEIEDLAKIATTTLSEITHYTTVAIGPKTEQQLIEERRMIRESYLYNALIKATINKEEQIYIDLISTLIKEKETGSIDTLKSNHLEKFLERISYDGRQNNYVKKEIINGFETEGITYQDNEWQPIKLTPKTKTKVYQKKVLPN